MTQRYKGNKEIKVEETELPSHIVNLLKTEISYLEELSGYTQGEVFRHFNLNRKCVNMIELELAKYKLDFFSY